MFDKLIESNSAEADFKPRGRYFTVSTVVVGILFFTAVVVSLYAQDLDLGTDNFEIAALLAPVAADAPQPPEPRQQTPQNTQQRQSDLPTGQVNMMRIDETHEVPDSISNAPNTVMTRPSGKFELDTYDSVPSGTATGNAIKPGTGSGDGRVEPDASEVVEAPDTVPPPIKVTPPVKPPTPSLGVITGKALHLPKPTYSATMRMLNLQGEVNVQVTVDENGKVISSKAVSGHPVLRGPAEKAAWGAKFGPTFLSKVPVKVTGVIVYRFSK